MYLNAALMIAAGFVDWGTAAVDVVIVGLLIGARARFANPRQG